MHLCSNNWTPDKKLATINIQHNNCCKLSVCSSCQFTFSSGVSNVDRCNAYAINLTRMSLVTVAINRQFKENVCNNKQQATHQGSATYDVLPTFQ
ncbi:hypothetical protein Trydic_g4329 [Trypoxylus dichotomus]